MLVIQLRWVVCNCKGVSPFICIFKGHRPPWPKICFKRTIYKAWMFLFNGLGCLVMLMRQHNLGLTEHVQVQHSSSKLAPGDRPIKVSRPLLTKSLQQFDHYAPSFWASFGISTLRLHSSFVLRVRYWSIIPVHPFKEKVQIRPPWPSALRLYPEAVLAWSKRYKAVPCSRELIPKTYNDALSVIMQSTQQLNCYLATSRPLPRPEAIHPVYKISFGTCYVSLPCTFALLGENLGSQGPRIVFGDNL